MTLEKVREYFKERLSIEFNIFRVSSSRWCVLPNTSGIGAIGVWMLACIIMVFAALIEYGIILFLMTKKQNSSIQINGNVINTVSTFDIDAKNSNAMKNGANVPDNDIIHDIILQRVDTISRFMFPVIFLAFVSVYSFLHLK